MKISECHKWIFRAVALMIGIIYEVAAFATTVDVCCPYYKNEFEYEGMTFKFMCTYTEPLTLSLIDASEETKGEIILPEEFLIHWEAASFPPTKAVIKRIESNAFINSNADSVTIPSSVTEIGDYAFYRSPVDKVYLNEGLRTIGSYVFSNTGPQWTIYIPESVISIGYGCFENCSALEHIYLPSTLKALGGGVFRKCRMLEDIYCSAKIPPIADPSDFGREEDVLTPILDTYPQHNRVPYNCLIHVPEESIELYKNAPGWNTCAFFVPLTEEDIIASTQKPENSDPSFYEIKYTVIDGELLVPVSPGDTVVLYDTNGIRLKMASYTTYDTFSYKGSGIVILYLNYRSVKISL